MGIRDFIQFYVEHREKLAAPDSIPDTGRAEMLRQAEMMTGMTDAAIKELESVLNNRRVNLHEEHAVRFAQDVFAFLRGEEERVKETLRNSRN